MKTAIICFSQTGNTRKIADKIREGLLGSADQCEAECPVDGIDIQSDPVRIQAPCIYCLHCASICPTCAIEADWAPAVRMAPANYARYTESLKEAEKRGEFRWLVDPGSVDCGYPLYRERIDKL